MFPAQFRRESDPQLVLAKDRPHGLRPRTKSEKFDTLLRELSPDVIGNIVEQSAAVTDAQFVWERLSALMQDDDKERDEKADCTIATRMLSRFPSLSALRHFIRNLRHPLAAIVFRDVLPRLFERPIRDTHDAGLAAAVHEIVCIGRQELLCDMPADAALRKVSAELSEFHGRLFLAEAGPEFDERHRALCVIVAQRPELWRSLEHTAYRAPITELHAKATLPSLVAGLREFAGKWTLHRPLTPFHDQLIRATVARLRSGGVYEPGAAPALIAQRYTIAERNPAVDDTLTRVRTYLSGLLADQDAQIAPEEALAISCNMAAAPAFHDLFAHALPMLQRLELPALLAHIVHIALEYPAALTHLRPMLNEIHARAITFDDEQHAALRALMLFSELQISHEGAAALRKAFVAMATVTKGSAESRTMVLTARLMERLFVAPGGASVPRFTTLTYDELASSLPLDWLAGERRWMRLSADERRDVLVGLLPYLSSEAADADPKRDRWLERLRRESDPRSTDAGCLKPPAVMPFVRGLRKAARGAACDPFQRGISYRLLLDTALTALSASTPVQAFKALSLFAADAHGERAAIFCEALFKRLDRDVAFPAEAALPHLVKRIDTSAFGESAIAQLVRSVAHRLHDADRLVALARIAAARTPSENLRAEAAERFLKEHERLASEPFDAPAAVARRRMVGPVISKSLAALPVAVQDASAVYHQVESLRDAVEVLKGGIFPQVGLERLIACCINYGAELTEDQQATFRTAVLRAPAAIPPHYFTETYRLAGRMPNAASARLLASIPDDRPYDPRILHYVHVFDRQADEADAALVAAELLRFEEHLTAPERTVLWDALATQTVFSRDVTLEERERFGALLDAHLDRTPQPFAIRLRHAAMAAIGLLPAKSPAAIRLIERFAGEISTFDDELAKQACVAIKYYPLLSARAKRFVEELAALSSHRATALPLMKPSLIRATQPPSTELRAAANNAFEALRTATVTLHATRAYAALADLPAAVAAAARLEVEHAWQQHSKAFESLCGTIETLGDDALRGELIARSNGAACTPQQADRLAAAAETIASAGLRRKALLDVRATAGAPGAAASLARAAFTAAVRSVDPTQAARVNRLAFVWRHHAHVEQASGAADPRPAAAPPARGGRDHAQVTAAIGLLRDPYRKPQGLRLLEAHASESHPLALLALADLHKDDDSVELSALRRRWAAVAFAYADEAEQTRLEVARTSAGLPPFPAFDAAVVDLPSYVQEGA